jgi:hypothetical protein
VQRLNCKVGPRIFALFLLLVTVSACCGPAAELFPVYVEKTPIAVVGGYSLGRPILSGLRLYGAEHGCYDDPKATCYPTVIEGSVVKIGWDDKYIIGERYPDKDAIFAKPDASNPTWFVIVVESNAVYEDLSYDEFAELLGKLGIPNLEMRNAMDVYRHK